MISCCEVTVSSLSSGDWLLVVNSGQEGRFSIYMGMRKWEGCQSGRLREEVGMD